MWLHTPLQISVWNWEWDKQSSSFLISLSLSLPFCASPLPPSEWNWERRKKCFAGRRRRGRKREKRRTEMPDCAARISPKRDWLFFNLSERRTSKHWKIKLQSFDLLAFFITLLTWQPWRRRRKKGDVASACVKSQAARSKIYAPIWEFTTTCGVFPPFCPGFFFLSLKKIHFSLHFCT